MKKAVFFISLFVISLLSLSLNGQNKATLEKEKKKLSRDISLTNQLLEEAKKKGNLQLEEIALLKEKIRLRTRMINNMSNEVTALANKISSYQNEIKELEVDLADLKKDYAQLIELSYKTKTTQSWMMYLFSSESFDQASRRMRYLKEISKLRDRQAQLIEKSKEELGEKTEALKADSQEKSKLLAVQEQEKRKLNTERKQAEEKLQDLKKDEKSLRKKLKEKELKRQKLSREIKRLIELEMKPTAGAKTFTLTPEEKLISGNFSKNKGKLPWPVERGVITGKFGSYPHDELKGITVTNNGIDISTDKNAIVRCIFKGEVAGVINIPGAGQAVMVKHGDYWTVYSNLSKVLVSKGETIDTKESVGVLLSDGANSKSHIEIWKHSSSGMTKLDPALWIAK